MLGVSTALPCLAAHSPTKPALPCHSAPHTLANNALGMTSELDAASLCISTVSLFSTVGQQSESPSLNQGRLTVMRDDDQA